MVFVKVPKAIRKQCKKQLYDVMFDHRLLTSNFLHLYSNNKTERLNRNNQIKKMKKDQVWLQKRTGEDFIHHTFL